MKRNILTGILMLLTSVLFAGQLSSPNGNLQLDVWVENGVPLYQLRFKGQMVIQPSRLGLEAKEAMLSSGFTLAEVTESTFDETWTPAWGEYSEIRDHHNEMAVTLVQREQQNRTLVVRFRLFDDGLGFRYEIPVQEGINYLALTDEVTEFNLTGNHLAFAIPGDYDTNEFAFSTAHLSELREDMERRTDKKPYETKALGDLVVQTPLMLKTAYGLYLNIHEAALSGYTTMMLNLDDQTFGMSAHLVPDKNGNKGFLQAPVHSPWRTIIVSDDARDILASQTILNLNEPSAYEDVSWITPMKYVGVWWEMFIGDGGTWAYSDDYKAKPGITNYTKLTPNERHRANTAHVKEYIDFAAEHGIDAVLVEGWNEGWEDWGSYRKDRQFLFTKPYPDFDVVALRDYAKERGVRLMMHHETASNAADYERQLDQAFQFMVDHNYNAVKTGYVGYIIPRSEYHYTQWMNDHYIYVAKRAADYGIMVNSHEATRPTGLSRTYPNWLAQESARGGEFETMGGNDPDHTTILPFTRLMGGPMDYTPGIFETKMSYYNGDKMDQQVHTTLVKQLALYVTMPSPLQMAADLPSNYRRFPDAFQFIKDVAVDWDYSWYLEAEPGDYITVARKAKGRDEWFIGAITDENPRVATIALDFLPRGQTFVATIYEDGEDAHWETNPQSYNIRQITVTNESVLEQRLAPGGGAAITIRTIN